MSDSGRPSIPVPAHDGEDEDARLAEFGYEQKLDRSVGKIASFAIGFSTISATRRSSPASVPATATPGRRSSGPCSSPSRSSCSGP